MKIEDIELQRTQEMDEHLCREEWLKMHKMDYFKAVKIMLDADDAKVRTAIFKSIYEVTRCYIPSTVYKYYSLDDNTANNQVKFDTLYRKKVFVSDAKDFNDPFDSQGFYYMPNAIMETDRFKRCNGQVVDDFRKYVKIACFTGNGFQSMPMWAHYSNNHKGFCVSYNISENDDLKLSLFPVQYVDRRLDITSEMKKQAESMDMCIARAQARGDKTILYDDLTIVYLALLLINIKEKQWEPENEYRYCAAAKAPDIPYICANPNAIYIGKDCEEKNARCLYDIAEHVGANVYKMQCNYVNDTYELNAVKYDKEKPVN